MNLWSRVRSFSSERAHVIALLTIIGAIQLFPKRAPLGIYALGTGGGAAMALNAMGMLLVYRSSKLINFAQIQIGVVSAVLFSALVQFAPLLRFVMQICPECAGSTTWVGVNYYLSLIISLLFSLAVSYGLYFATARRLAQAPRLIVTVATIFAAQLLAGIAGSLPRLFASEEQRDAAIELGPNSLPFDFTFQITPVRFHAAAGLTVATAFAAAGLLTVFLKKSATGIAIRSASENPDRASTLGINVGRVTARVWLLAGALSWAAAILASMSASPVGQSPLQVAGMVRLLAVVVIASLWSLPVAFIGSLVFGILDQAVLWSFGSLVVLDGVMLFIISIVLMLQRFRSGRADTDFEGSWRATREAKPTPRVLRDLHEVVRMKRITVAVITIALLGSPWLLSPRQISTASAVMTYAIAGLSLLLLTGWAGQISLGQFAFAAVGGWVVALVQLPFPFGLILGALAGSAVAIAVGLPALKMRGLHLAITSLAFALTATTLVLNQSYLGRFVEQTIDRPSLFGMDLDDERTFYYATLLILILVTFAVVGIRRSRAGRVLIAARDNANAALSFGVNLVRVRLSAFAVSGFIAALAGGLFALNQHGVRSASFSPETSITIFLMSVIGGLGSILGPLLGAVYLGVLEFLAASSSVTLLLTGALGLGLIQTVPGGLAQVVFSVRDAMLRRFARRNRIPVPSLMGEAMSVGGKASIEPRRETTGGAYIPVRYRLKGQWAIEPSTPPTEEPTGG